MVQWQGAPSIFTSQLVRDFHHDNITTLTDDFLLNPSTTTKDLFSQTMAQIMLEGGSMRHASQPGIGNLIFLVFEAVMEVVCVSLPGYIIGRMGMFDTEQQKFLSNLNVSLFTPCLIFSKLAKQLDPNKFAELVIIPVIFVIMTAVSYFCAIMVAKMFKLRKRATNFVIAMGVFGNSNSLPISLVMSLSFTISGLHWDEIPGDNDKDVAARGILYLLIFQQLGQIVRWTWGYNYLLQPSNQYTVEEGGTGTNSEGQAGPPSTDSIDSDSEWEYDEETLQRKPTQPNPFIRPGFNEWQGLASPSVERPHLFSWGSSFNDSTFHKAMVARRHTLDSSPFTPNIPSGLTAESPTHTRHHLRRTTERTENSDDSDQAGNGSTAPFTPHQPSSSNTTPESTRRHSPSRRKRSPKPSNGNGDITSFPEPPENDDDNNESTPLLRRIVNTPKKEARKCCPPGLYHFYIAYIVRPALKIWDFMNPPLWAMIFSIVVASVPALKHLFFTPGTFVQNSVTRAVNQSGQVAVPLILVVLGANLANSQKATLTSNDETAQRLHKATARHELKLLIASLVSRMLLPFCVMAPLLAIAAKYNPVSILDDPIFIIVCFLLTGAPSALQLSQICQLNGVYEDVIGRILFWSYVVVILPSTIILVVVGLEVVQWAQ